MEHFFLSFVLIMLENMNLLRATKKKEELELQRSA